VKRFEVEVDFLTIYINEAHPKGGWEAPDQPNVVADAASTEERHKAAMDFFKKCGYAGKLAVDSIENHGMLLYSGMPDRIFVIDASRRFVHVQEPGPLGYQPPELVEFLEKSIKQQS